jgi:hypothetical protein
MVAGLAAMPRLKSFAFRFQLATHRPDQSHPPPVTRTVLPALTTFEFQGASEYLEDLVSRIDGPQLKRIYIYYLNQLVDFQVAQFLKFIDRSVGPKLNLLRYEEVTFDYRWVAFSSYRHPTDPYRNPSAETFILCAGIEWQVSHVAQVLSQFSATISTVVHLELDYLSRPNYQFEGTDDVEWQHLLHQFSAVQTLHVHRKLAAHVARALEDTTGQMVAEVLPSLDLIYLADRPASSIEKFVAARQLSDRPVTVVKSHTEFKERLKSYITN